MLYLSDLNMPEGVEIPELTHGRDAPVVSIHHARAEEVAGPGEEAAAGAPAAAAPAAAAAAKPAAAAAGKPAAAAKPAEAKGKEGKK
jgi:large subunit ribosomal protein L25